MRLRRGSRLHVFAIVNVFNNLENYAVCCLPKFVDVLKICRFY